MIILRDGIGCKHYIDSGIKTQECNMHTCLKTMIGHGCGQAGHWEKEAGPRRTEEARQQDRIARNEKLYRNTCIATVCQICYNTVSCKGNTAFRNI